MARSATGCDRLREYLPNPVDSELYLTSAQQASFCLDCIRKLEKVTEKRRLAAAYEATARENQIESGSTKAINAFLSQQFAAELSQCAMVPRAGNQPVTEVLALMWSDYLDGVDISKMDQQIAALLPSGTPPTGK